MVWALLDYPKSMGQWSGHIGLQYSRHRWTHWTQCSCDSRTHRSPWYKVAMHIEQKVDTVDKVNTEYSGYSRHSGTQWTQLNPMDAVKSEQIEHIGNS
jgi:hypothetical protein